MSRGLGSSVSLRLGILYGLNALSGSILDQRKLFEICSELEGHPDDAGPANRWDYAGATPVQWWRLDGAGHTTPSQTVLTGSNPVTGTQSRDIEFAEVVWAFFESRLLD